MALDQRGWRRVEGLLLETTTAWGARFATETGPLEVEFYTSGVVRLRLGAGDAPDYDLLVAPPEPTRVLVQPIGSTYRLEAGGLSLELLPGPLRFRLYRQGQLVLETTTDADPRGGLRVIPFGVLNPSPVPPSLSGEGETDVEPTPPTPFPTREGREGGSSIPPFVREGSPVWQFSVGLRSGEAVYGLGETFGPLNRRGQLITSWNADALGANAEASAKNVPFAWSPSGWGVWVHKPGRVEHGVGYAPWSQRSYIARVEDSALDVFLIAGGTPADLLERYSYLTGRAPVATRWSLGVWLSPVSYPTAEDAMQVARELRLRSIPCDGLVVAGQAYNRAVYEGGETYAEQGALIWGQSGWTGSQRYPVMRGSDAQSDWEGLAASIRGGLAWGLSGGPYYASAIGGFYGETPSPELFVRWAQAGVLSSHTIFRGNGPAEPWEFGIDAERVVREWLEWRYRLLPYLEGCALEAQRTGLPIVRAMPLAFPNDPAAWAFDTQYMLGPSLLVAPIIQPGGAVQVYLPAGRWYDFQNDTWYAGGRVYKLTLSLDQAPLFGREGYLLPLGPVVNRTGELGQGTTLEEIWVFGMPQHGMALPGLRLEVERVDGKSRLRGVPDGVTVQAFGNIRAAAQKVR